MIKNDIVLDLSLQGISYNIATWQHILHFLTSLPLYNATSQTIKIFHHFLVLLSYCY